MIGRRSTRTKRAGILAAALLLTFLFSFGCQSKSNETTLPPPIDAKEAYPPLPIDLKAAEERNQDTFGKEPPLPITVVEATPEPNVEDLQAKSPPMPFTMPVTKEPEYQLPPPPIVIAPAPKSAKAQEASDSDSENPKDE